MHHTAGLSHHAQGHRCRTAYLSSFCLALWLIAGCQRLPSPEHRAGSTAELDTGATRLGRAILPQVLAHPGKSGVYPLSDARDAFSARTMLAQAAERTLDVQYYIWRDDMTGTMLFTALRKAADRGVQVRLLLDDNNTAGLDTALAALDSHPNIAVRLFNPFVVRHVRTFGFLTDFSRANRRMHNKSFTADSQATIVGGRNVGDEYFGAAGGVLFADLDVMAVGPVVTEIAKDFDRYWNSNSSYPADRVLLPADRVATEHLSAAASQRERSPSAVAYASAVRRSVIIPDLMQGKLALEWAMAHMVSDDPAKGLGLAKPGTLIFDRLKATMGEPLTELNVVSPYFVPTEAGAAAFVAIARRGVKVRVLTNALEATDVAAVHSGYAKHRKTLLNAGISLYELRRLSTVSAPGYDRGFSGSSASSLHSKTFSFDRSRVFIGSINFDPRSAKLNTEMGIVIDSPVLAGRISAAFDQRIPAEAYQVGLSADGQLYWHERRGSKVLRHDVEPGTSAPQRAAVRLMSLLPIDWLL